MWEGQGVSITACEELDWRQALGVYMWYVCNPITSIGHVLGEYEKSYEVREREEGGGGGERERVMVGGGRERVVVGGGEGEREGDERERKVIYN